MSSAHRSPIQTDLIPENL